MDNLRVSLIIPVYNDPSGVSATLDSLLSQSFENEQYEIIVSDNNSGEKTQRVIDKYEEENSLIHSVQETEIQSSYAARNTAIEHASGSILGFIDADMTVDTTWLEDAVSAFDEEIDYMAYDVEVYQPNNTNTLVGRYNVYTAFPIREYIQQQHFGGAGCIFVRKSVIEDVGPFDWRFVSGGDSEFGQRIYEAGYNITFTDAITARHPARTSLRSQIKKEVRVGRGFCQRQRYYPDRYGSPGSIPKPSGVKTSGSIDKPTPPMSDRILFTILSVLFLGFRGLGYLLELTVDER